MFSIFKRNKLSSSERMDIIENNVLEYLKNYGFKKYGRTLHRYIDGDISQVVHFQNRRPSKRGYGIMWINLGIRVPECVERKFVITEPLKKYYHEDDCNIRANLGSLVSGDNVYFDLKIDPYELSEGIIDLLDRYVLPIFNTLNSRDAILELRRNYDNFDQPDSQLILLEEAMIYGRKGDLNKASELFRQYYSNELNEYNRILQYGTKFFLRKGEKLTYFNAKTNQTETINATKSGSVIIYNANKEHLTYLEELAKELNISLPEKNTNVS